MNPSLTLTQIKAEAKRLGFSACGAVRAGRVGAWRTKQYEEWLAQERHGTMDYLLRHAQLRTDPRLVVEGARTIVMLALNYAPQCLLPAEGYTLARYAYGQDYHEVMKQRLRMLMLALHLQEGEHGRVFCDTFPLDERYWAWRCGLGAWGRNSQFILQRAGSYHFLGGLLLTVDIDGINDNSNEEAEPRVEDICGKCHRCLDACPTSAIAKNQCFDATRCLSYLTIEYRGSLTNDVGRLMGKCFYGCDRCAEVCPHNHNACPTTEKAFLPSPKLLEMQTADWEQLTPQRYQEIFKGSAVKRAKFEGLQRNIQAIQQALSIKEKGESPKIQEETTHSS